MPIDVELYVTDGQHRLKAIEKVLPEKPDLRNDSVTVLVVQEADMDQIHQDFADCAKNKPIPPALLAAFDVTDPLAKLTRTITKDLVIFNGRIDKISGKLGKDTNYIFTMSQLKIGVAEFLFGSSRKQVIESHSRQSKSEFLLMLERLKIFYTEFAKNNDTWRLLLQPASQTVNLNLYDLRQQRVDFNTVGFQVLSRIGHFIFFGQEFTDLQREALIKALAGLDYTRDSALWLNSIVTDDDGTKKIVSQSGQVDKAFKIARNAVQEKTGISLI
jgi:DGQHR domain-containing protein